MHCRMVFQPIQLCDSNYCACFVGCIQNSVDSDLLASSATLFSAANMSGSVAITILFHASIQFANFIPA